MISFCCAFWDYLRGLRRDEPDPADHGLDEAAARMLRVQCQIEFDARKARP